MIRKRGNKFVVLSHDGSREFGTYDSREEAEKRLVQIESHKEFRFASGGILESKSIEDTLVVSGYIATTHKDSVNDVIKKETLEKWAKEINEGIPRANKVTYHHDRSDKRVVGVGIKGSAKVDRLPDGEYGLYVETIVNKAHDLYEDIEYEYNIGALDSFSIEYVYPDGSKENDEFRILDERTELYGWTLASRPVNDKAVMIKELFEQKAEVRDNAALQKKLEDLAELLIRKDPSLTPEKAINAARAIFFRKNMEKEESDSLHLSSKEAGVEEKQMAEKDEKIVALEAQLKELQDKLSAKEQAEIKAAQEAEAKEKIAKAEDAKKQMEEMYAKKEQEFNSQLVELKETIAKISEIKEAKLETESKEQKVPVEIKELHDAVKAKASYKELASKVGAVLQSRGLTGKTALKELANTAEIEEGKYSSRYFVNRVAGKEVIEYKGLSLGDNVNSNYVNATTTIGLSQAELQDVVMPVIFNALNESTVTWDLLAKDNMASQGTNRVVFVLKTGNSGAYFSKGNAITTTETDREKYSIEYKKIYIGGAVDGDLQAYSRGGPFGEALALEIADRTIALKVKMNQALFDENAGNKAGAEPLGIPAITDSAGNTSLYDTTRSAANKLSPDAAGDTYVTGAGGLTEPMLRNAIEQATTDGSRLEDLIFVGTPAVINKYKALFDNKERLVPYSDRAGFKNAPDFEGVPLFADKDAKADSLFLIDTSALRVAILVPPTVEMLGKRSDSEEFFVKSYYAVYCTAPRRLVEIYSIA